MRLALVVTCVIAARAAHADPPRRMAVALGPAGEGWTRTLVPSGRSQFPAVSADGRTIVELFHDEQDFVGRPIATIVFWSDAKRVASFSLESDSLDGTSTTSLDQARFEAQVVAAANARLGRTRWRPLPPTTDVRVTFDEPHQTLGGDVRGVFPAPGELMDKDLGSGGCGGITGIDRVLGSRALGFVVVVPTVSFGGDSCMGMPIADLATVVAVPSP